MPAKALVGITWSILGLGLAAWAVWGASTAELVTLGLVATYAIQLAYAALAVAAGILFVRGARYGRPLLLAVSIITLAYAAIWLLFGGVDDASHYALPLLFLVALSLYGLILSWSSASAV